MNDNDENKLVEALAKLADLLECKIRSQQQSAEEVRDRITAINARVGGWDTDEISGIVDDAFAECSGSQELDEDVRKLCRGINRLLDDEDKGAV